MPPIWLIKAGVVLLLLAGFAGYGYHHGSQRVQRKWDAQVQADKAAAEALRESNRLRAQAASVDYEVQRAAIARRATQPSRESSYALHATICPPAGALGRALELGDVPVSGAVLDRLRDAGADFTGH
jgi:hypothetical protein